MMSDQSPSDELSGAESAPFRDGEKLMEEDEEEDGDIIVFLPFLSKAGAKVVTVSTQSEEGKEEVEVKGNGDESVQIIDDGEKEDEVDTPDGPWPMGKQKD